MQQWWRLTANHGASNVSTSNDGATNFSGANYRNGGTDVSSAHALCGRLRVRLQPTSSFRNGATNNAFANVTCTNDRARAASVHSRRRFSIRFWRLLHVWRWWLQPRFLLFRHGFYYRAAGDSGV